MKKGDQIAKPPKKRKILEQLANEGLPTAPMSVPLSFPSMTRPSTRSSTVNLTDWVDSAVLVKQPSNYYYPGVIHSVLTPTSVEVLLDKNGDKQTFHDVLDRTDMVLSNHSAPAIMIKQGINVCVKCKPSDNFFTVCTVKEVKQGPPMHCYVQFSDTQNEAWVSRAAIRLIQPPWYDDLEDTGGQEVRKVELSVVLE